jgi:hypothetical protein
MDDMPIDVNYVMHRELTVSKSRTAARPVSDGGQ